MDDKIFAPKPREIITKENIIQFQDLEIGIQADFSEIIAKLNLRFGTDLKTRLEGFHITIISPLESKILRDFTKEDVRELQEIIIEIQQGRGLSIKGIGYIDGSNSVFRVQDFDRTKKVAFIALDIPRMREFRKRKELPPKDFHITLGFENDDIHEQINNQGESELMPKQPDPKFNDLIILLPKLKFTGLKETKETDPNVEELKRLINDSNFEAQFLAVQTRVERAKRNKLLNSAQKRDLETRLAEANALLLQATKIQTQNLNQLKKALEQPTPQLVEALNIWGRSRNVRGEYGPDQKGFNAGVVHYFEYRAHVGKNKKRFKPEYTFSVGGFIAHTKQYKSFLENSNPTTNSQIETARLLEDSKGNRRLYILTKEKEFIVGFERVGEGMKILSVFLEQNTQKLNKATDDELNSTEKARTRFNRLEGVITEIPL